MTNRFRVSTTLPRKLEELGLSPETVLRQAGLPMGLFNQEKILVSTEEFFALYQGIAETSNDPGFGLKVGTEERIATGASGRISMIRKLRVGGGFPSATKNVSNPSKASRNVMLTLFPLTYTRVKVHRWNFPKYRSAVKEYRNHSPAAMI